MLCLWFPFELCGNIIVFHFLVLLSLSSSPAPCLASFFSVTISTARACHPPCPFIASPKRPESAATLHSLTWTQRAAQCCAWSPFLFVQQRDIAGKEFSHAQFYFWYCKSSTLAVEFYRLHGTNYIKLFHRSALKSVACRRSGLLTWSWFIWGFTEHLFYFEGFRSPSSVWKLKEENLQNSMQNFLSVSSSRGFSSSAWKEKTAWLAWNVQAPAPSPSLPRVPRDHLQYFNDEELVYKINVFHLKGLRTPAFHC